MKFTLSFLQIIRFLILVPVIRISAIFVPWVSRRLKFEARNNQVGPLAKKASVTFQVSSEGELEQALPLIEKFLTDTHAVEILYSSDSVEKKIDDLRHRHPENLRAWCMPLLSWGPRWLVKLLPSSFQNIENWLSAETLVMVRYDFYPELLLGLYRKYGVLIEASLIGKKLDGLKGFFFKKVLGLFSLVVPPSQRDSERIASLTGVVPELILEPRTLRIRERLARAQDKLSRLPGPWQSLERIQGRRRVIIGSAWEHDLEFLADKQIWREMEEGNLNVWIAPHKLSEGYIDGIHNRINQLRELAASSVKVERLVGRESFSHAPMVIVTIPGILCELYRFFPCAFVGGGFGRSIHSVLEPYVAGASVLCGPRTERSTEFELIQGVDPDNIKSISRWSDDSRKFLLDKSNPANRVMSGKLDEQEKAFQNLYRRIEQQC